MDKKKKNKRKDMSELARSIVEKATKQALIESKENPRPKER